MALLCTPQEHSMAAILFPVPAFDPLGKLLPLLPDVDEAWSTLQEPERVPPIVLVHFSVGVHESLLALALDLAGPDAPLDGPQGGSSQDESKAGDQQCHDDFIRDVNRQRR